MSTAASKISITDREFNDLRKIIYERSGIHFPDGKKYVLESRLGHRLAELEMENFTQYIQFLSMGPYMADEFQEMFNRITINETSFFRNEPQLDIFEKTVLPEILEARQSTRRLRVWSAACSTGEEPYTLAILIQRSLGIRINDWRIEILGTDISEKALEVAESAKYTEYAMRSTPPIIRQRFFKNEGPYSFLNDATRSMVTFEKHNLRDRLGAKRHGVWDVIFCRNVMIYFDDAMKKQVLNMFADQLADDGYLFIGHSETIRSGEAPFQALPLPQGFCYRKLTSKTI
ncbi:MAG: protein-glutamate O-methyltransferase CheR [Phycisphaerales bacterium]|jgi:chemotaxis protein methyltransferase CheR|nr:protein-glutamate O-methyltransferase CheR [Phycisphaerales bacterium]